MVSAPVVDELYLLEFEVTAIAGGYLTPSVGGMNGNPVGEVGIHQQYITASSATSGVILTPSDAGLTCTIDNISLLKVADRLCILIDYEDSEDDPLYMSFIKRVTDPTKYSPSFINALAFRLAAELSINRTESQNKYAAMMQMYEGALIRAEGVNQSLDYLDSEQGSDDWESAGR